MRQQILADRCETRSVDDNVATEHTPEGTGRIHRLGAHDLRN